MTRPPRPRGERLLAWRVLARVYGWVGLWEACGAMAGFLAGNWLGGWRPFAPLADSGATYVEATTMTQTGIVTGQVGASLAMRTERQSVFSVGLFSNRFLIVAIAIEMLLALLLIYVPGLNAAFHQSPIGPWHWLVLLTFAPLVFGMEELRKAVFRRWVWFRKDVRHRGLPARQ
jgi:magnesium-transporting ATPase (P-type)